MEEIDREKQKTKQAKAALGEAERRAEVSRQGLDAANMTLGDKLQQTEIELRSVCQALASANERSSELRALLDEQGATSAVALKQLNLLLSDQPHKTPAASLARRRRTK